MLNPKVAIVIPAYNEEAILQKTIDKMENLMKNYAEKGVINFALSDEIRNTLKDMGYIVKDTPQGPVLERV